MRPHRRRPPPDPQQAWQPFVALHEDALTFLMEEAAFALRPSIIDYAYCQLCGRPIGFGQAIAATVPHADYASTICWYCMTSILIHRGAIDPATDPLPNLYALAPRTFFKALQRTARSGDRRS